MWLIKGNEGLGAFFSSVFWDTLSPCQPTDSWLGRILVCSQEPLPNRPLGVFLLSSSYLRTDCSVKASLLCHRRAGGSPVQCRHQGFYFKISKCLLVLYPFPQRYFSWSLFWVYWSFPACFFFKALFQWERLVWLVSGCENSGRLSCNYPIGSYARCLTNWRSDNDNKTNQPSGVSCNLSENGRGK